MSGRITPIWSCHSYAISVTEVIIIIIFDWFTLCWTGSYCYVNNNIFQKFVLIILDRYFNMDLA